MSEHSDNQVGSGLKRALDRVRAPIGRATGQGGKEVPSSDRRGSRSPAGMGEAQSLLREQGQLRHEGLELWPLPGLAPMTRVRTSFGDVHSIALRKGDKVLLKSGEYKPILWINRIMLDEHILGLKPDSNPIQLAAGSLGPGVPSVEMMMSPRQIVCADERSGLNKAREAAMLVSRAGIRRYRETGLTYTMFHVGESADIFCEGIFLRFPIET